MRGPVLDPRRTSSDQNRQAHGSPGVTMQGEIEDKQPNKLDDFRVHQCL